MALNDKILEFLQVWQAKVGDSALKAVNDAVDYNNQQTDLQPVFNVSFAGGSVKWTLGFNKDYWQYIEKGVDGTQRKHGSPFSFKNDKDRIPVKGLSQWIEKRGIRVQIKEGVKGKQKSLNIEKGRKSLAFALSISIKRKGIKPKPFVDNILTQELRDEFKAGMTKIFKEEIIISFNQP
jgi:hypothetical protein